MPIPRPLLRRLLLALLCLAIGAVTTIAIAWYIAARGSLVTYTGQYTHAATPADIPWLLRDDWPTPEQVRVMPGTQRGYELRGVDCIAAGHEGDKEGGRVLTLWSSRFGWPMHALQRFELSSFGGNADVTRASEALAREFPNRGSLPLPTKLIQPATGGATTLPAWPLWLGFAVDTTLYALLAAAIISAPAVLRRRAWRKAGKCTGCGYEITDLQTCPECGGRA